jgi:hypothetical protein
MNWRDKTMGELFPNAMKRWPRTFMLGLLFLSLVLAAGALVCAVLFLGSYGPVYLGVAALAYTVGSAVRGDLQDQKRQQQ